MNYFVVLLNLSESWNCIPQSFNRTADPVQLVLWTWRFGFPQFGSVSRFHSLHLFRITSKSSVPAKWRKPTPECALFRHVSLSGVVVSLVIVVLSWANKTCAGPLWRCKMRAGGIIEQEQPDKGRTWPPAVPRARIPLGTHYTGFIQHNFPIFFKAMWKAVTYFLAFLGSPTLCLIKISD